jgi:hypothetical protein
MNSVVLRSVNGWLTIMSRIDLNFPVNQVPTAYETGFGDILSNFWLGLTNVYYLTNPNENGGKKFRLRFEFLSVDLR